jgi:hypothetical protein
MAPGGNGNPGDPRTPQGQRQQQYSPNKSKKPRNEPELYDGLIRGGGPDDDKGEHPYDEFDDSLPTANHSKTETDLTRSKASLMSEYRSFLRTLGLQVGDSDFIQETSRQLMFINQSSKAKKGFGDLLVRTDHVYQTVDEYSTLDSGESSGGGVVGQLKDSISGAMGGQQVIGDPAEEGFISSDKNRGGKWR